MRCMSDGHKGISDKMRLQICLYLNNHFLLDLYDLTTIIFSHLTGARVIVIWLQYLRSDPEWAFREHWKSQLNIQGLALLTLSWDKNWDSHSLVNGYPSFYPRIALVAPSPGHPKGS